MTSPRRWLRRLLLGLALLLLLFPALVTGVGCALSGPVYRGPASDHFDGERFLNMREVPHGGFGSFLRWQWTRERGAWTERQGPVGAAAAGARRARRPAGHLRQPRHHAGAAGRDQPADRPDLVGALQPLLLGRARAASSRPAIRFEDLPPIDAVVVSHNHYDHLDLPTLRRLAAAHRPRFFVGLGNRALLEKAGIERVTEIDWWQTVRLGDEVELTGVPAQHFSNRGLFDRDGTLWLGYLLRGPAGTTFFAGDTGAGPHFAEIRRRYGSPRLAAAAHRGVPAGVVHGRRARLARGGGRRPRGAGRRHQRRHPLRHLPPRRRRPGRAAAPPCGPPSPGAPEAGRPRFLVLAPGEGHDVE